MAEQPKIDPKLLIDYIKCKKNVEAIKFAEEAGKYLATNGFTSTKLRNIFGEIESIYFKITSKSEDKIIISKRIALLKPKLVYIVAKEERSKKDVVEYFKNILLPMIDELLNSENDDKFESYFENFLNFVKAIISYHKYYGGK